MRQLLEQMTAKLLFGYDPNLAVAWVTMSVFIVLGILLILVNFKFRPCTFMYILVGCAWAEALGYGLRVLAANQPAIITFIFPTLLILLAPNAIAFVNYMVVGKALALSGLNIACLRPNWIARTFLASDVFSFGLQGVGGSMLTSTDPKTNDTGKKIILAGLAIQCLTLFLFLFVAINVHVKPQYLLKGKPDGDYLSWGLYSTTFLLFVRSIYRAIEYGGGKGGYSATHEWLAYAFDAVPIALSFLCYMYFPWHFGRCLNSLRVQCEGQSFDANAPQSEEPAVVPNVAMQTIPTNKVAPAPEVITV